MADSEEKNLPASDKKLRDAREKGQVPKSTDLVAGAVTLAGFGYTLAVTATMVARSTVLIDLSVRAAALPFAEAARFFVGKVLWFGVLTVLPMLLLIVAAASASSVLAMGGVIIAFDPLVPKLSHLNPVEGFGKLFKLDKLVALLKDVLKLIVVVTTALLLIRASFQLLVEQPACGLRCAPAALTATVLPILVMGSVLFVVVGIADVSIQRWLFARNMRMSETEQKQERKNSDGDPQIKGQMKRLRKESLQLLSGLRQATFILAGPDHAVGLRYSLPRTAVPTLVVRARDDRVADLLEAGREMRLPMHDNPELAHEVAVTVQLGLPIPQELYKRVIDCMKAMNIPLRDD